MIELVCSCGLDWRSCLSDLDRIVNVDRVRTRIFLLRPKQAQLLCEVLGNHRGHLSKAGWSRGGIVDTHRNDGKQSISRADEKLTVFLDSNRRFEPSIHQNKRVVDPLLSVILLKPNLNLIAV
jgi:hypothetical protein